jgi:hypothetical protein
MESSKQDLLPKTHSTGAAKRRVHLTEETKLSLIKLCIENQADFQQGKKMQFWATMSELLQQEAAIHLKDPAGKSNR